MQAACLSSRGQCRSLSNGTDNCCFVSELQEQLTMVVHARHPELNYALLQCDKDHAYLPVYHEPSEQLLGADLALAGSRIGVEQYTPIFSRRLGFTKADTITLSNHNDYKVIYTFLRCSTFAGDSGSALILKDGCLVAIHPEAINALRERLQHAKLVKDGLTEAEKSIDAIVNGGVA
ncbi:TPA: hypothetical protein ACH3X2_000948 [Trebouxia sp. C0005]